MRKYIEISYYNIWMFYYSNYSNERQTSKAFKLPWLIIIELMINKLITP